MRKKITGVAGDGAFIKGNEPFKETLRDLLQNPNLKWRWDILHLVNRAFESARSKTGKGVAHCTHKLMDYVQGQSKAWRTGLDYTTMRLETLKSFKRPKVWSDTRMVNFEYDQLLRFCECAIWWDLPNWVDVLCRLYLPSTFVLKVILAKAQSTKVKSEWVTRVLDGESPDGKKAMKCAVDVAKAAFNSGGADHLPLISNMPDILKTNLADKKNTSNIFQNEFSKWMKKHKDLFVVDRLSAAKTRNELDCDVDKLCTHLHKYVDVLFDEIATRMDYTDKDGSTSWSEAPSESIFSVFKMVLHGRESLTVGHTIALCRLMTNGPKPGTLEAEKLMDQAAKKWNTHNGLQFTTANWQIRFVSKLISQLKASSSVTDALESDDDDDQDS